jgi:hypothetical protein
MFHFFNTFFASFFTAIDCNLGIRIYEAFTWRRKSTQKTL